MYRLHLAKVRSVTRHLLEDRLSERARIARDLHDTLLQGFHGLMFRLEAVRQLLPERPDDAAEFLDSALLAGDQAMGEGREAVQGLRLSSIQNRYLETSLSALEDELGAAIDPPRRPRYRLRVAGGRRALTAVVLDEAYRVAREAVRNAYEHAQAGDIETELIFGDTHLTIRVRDNGIGVDPRILARGQRRGHWGLPGMRERSEGLGGQFHIWSILKGGTEVELRIPAKVAYLVGAKEAAVA
jgi:signal transduction histidine kinase